MFKMKNKITGEIVETTLLPQYFDPEIWEQAPNEPWEDELNEWIGNNIEE